MLTVTIAANMQPLQYSFESVRNPLEKTSNIETATAMNL
jgi:hypothetical protein